IALIVVLIVLLCLRVPVGFALGIIGIGGYYFIGGVTMITTAASASYFGLSGFELSAMPLYILMGEIILHSGIGRDLFEVARKWVGHLKAGLAISSVAACAMFGAMCGTSTGGTVTIGAVAIPEMMREGYHKRLATGTIAAAGGLGMLIPPSIPMILYASVTETSVGRLFMAGLIPGIILAILYASFAVLIATRCPSWAPLAPAASFKERVFSLRKLWVVLVLVIAVLGTIYLGITTPTESASFGVIGALLIAWLFYRTLNRKTLKEIFFVSARTAVSLGIILAGAIIFGSFVTAVNIPQDIIKFIGGLHIAPWVTIIGLMAMLFVVGMFISASSMVLITVPILYPLVISLGYDPYWFGIIMILACEMATITPPVGFNLFVIKSISPKGVTMWDIIAGAFPFVICDFTATLIILFFPQIATWLPNTM
ncbi:TRAP transporter large permease, partial [Chloroflexota bacterium]